MRRARRQLRTDSVRFCGIAQESRYATRGRAISHGRSERSGRRSDNPHHRQRVMTTFLRSGSKTVDRENPRCACLEAATWIDPEGPRSALKSARRNRVRSASKSLRSWADAEAYSSDVKDP